MSPARIAVCLVDDEQPIVAALMRAFMASWTVTAVTRGKDAYELLRSAVEFDAVVLDCFMPDMNGLEIYNKLYSEGMFARCQRIAFFTAGADHPTLGPALEATGRPILAKPADLGAVDKVVRQLAAQTISRGAFLSTPPPHSPRPEEAFASDNERRVRDALDQSLRYKARDLPEVTDWEESPTKTRLTVPNTDPIRRAIEKTLDEQKRQAALELAAGRWFAIVKVARWMAVQLLKGVPWYAVIRFGEHLITHAPKWFHG